MQNEQPAHHPQAPSKLEKLDPRSGGCAAFMSSPEASEKAAFGTLKHVAVSTRDLSILEGDAEAEAEVSRMIGFIDGYREKYPAIHSELTLGVEKIFGTLDHLGFTIDSKSAVIIDCKFGVWSVTPARSNLQGLAYVLLAFHNFPDLKKITVLFFHAKSGLHSEHTFWRYRLPAIERRIYKIIDRAVQAQQSPTTKDFTPNAVNCSFCVRLNCPARLAMLNTMVTVWTQKPVELPHLNLLEVSTPQLAALKRLSNVFKTFAKAVDDEARRRAFDSGDIVEGYEIAEKNGARTVVGANNITETSKVLASSLGEVIGGKDWGDYVLKNVELSVFDLEKEIQKSAPRGKGALAKKIIADALENAGLINSNKIYYLRAKVE